MEFSGSSAVKKKKKKKTTDKQQKKTPACRVGDSGGTCSIPGLRRSPGGGHGKSLQYSCLENPMYRKAWQITVQKVVKSRT